MKPVQTMKQRLKDRFKIEISKLYLMVTLIKQNIIWSPGKF